MRAADDKPYDLEERTYRFVREIRQFLGSRSWDPVAWSDVQQLLRSSGSVAANFIEVVEAISERDRTHRYRICKKEARESGLWLRLLDDCQSLSESETEAARSLRSESDELVRILASIIRKRELQTEAARDSEV